jgi:predicted metal-binding protein
MDTIFGIMKNVRDDKIYIEEDECMQTLENTKNIAIMTCNKMTYDCSGTGCFDAFNNKTKAFERYLNHDVCLKAFFHCNGCDKDFMKVQAYKFEQLKKRNVTTIHMALCIDVECHRYDELKGYLLEGGFEVVDGSH